MNKSKSFKPRIRPKKLAEHVAAEGTEGNISFYEALDKYIEEDATNSTLGKVGRDKLDPSLYATTGSHSHHKTEVEDINALIGNLKQMQKIRSIKLKQASNLLRFEFDVEEVIDEATMGTYLVDHSEDIEEWLLGINEAFPSPSSPPPPPPPPLSPKSPSPATAPLYQHSRLSGKIGSLEQESNPSKYDTGADGNEIFQEQLSLQVFRRIESNKLRYSDMALSQSTLTAAKSPPFPKSSRAMAHTTGTSSKKENISPSNSASIDFSRAYGSSVFTADGQEFCPESFESELNSLLGIDQEDEEQGSHQPSLCSQALGPAQESSKRIALAAKFAALKKDLDDLA